MAKHDDPNVLNFPGVRPGPPNASSAVPEVDLLAELKEAMARAEAVPAVESIPNVRPSRTQTAVGTGNMLAGRDLHVHDERQAPQLVEYILCPACESKIPPLADICWNCNNNVARHFAILHARRVRVRGMVAATAFFCVFGLAMGALQFELVPQDWRTSTGVVAGAAAFLALVIGKEIS